MRVIMAGAGGRSAFLRPSLKRFPGLCLLALAVPSWGQVQVAPLPDPSTAKPASPQEERPWSGSELPKTRPPEGMSDAAVQLLRAEAAKDDLNALWKLAAIAASNMDAFLFVQRAAELGDHRAQYELASMYAEGRGTARDMERANFWGRKAAEGGHQRAQTSLGLTLLQSGKDATSRDEGLALLEKSSSEGNKRAALLLSAIYAQGAFGVPVNELKAGSVLQPFAEKEDPDCQVALASIYHFAKLHEKERDLAIVWLQRAKENGHPEAGKILQEIQREKSAE